MPKPTLQDFYGQRPVRAPAPVTVTVRPMAPRAPPRSGPAAAPGPRLPGSVTIKVPESLREPLGALAAAATSVGQLGQTAGQFGDLGLLAVLGLAAYGTVRWYKAKKDVAPRRRRLVKPASER